MSIPYRTHRTLKTFFTALLAVVLFASLTLVLWLLWLNRYVVYGDGGARLDFSVNAELAPGVVPVQPEPSPTVNVHNKVEEDNPNTPDSTELKQFSGYYVTVEDLLEDFDTVEAQLSALPKNSTVLLELKDVRSRVYYTSEYAGEKKDFDTGRMDALIADLQAAGHYLIARIPAFQEYDYILEDEMTRVPYGLAQAGGNGSLWLDRSYPCYWLNPLSDGTLSRLIQLLTELRGLGFDEVVFADFRMPDTDSIQFERDRLTALNDTAAMLVKTCSTSTFCVSFTRSVADLTLPQGRTRLYLTGVAASNAAGSAAASGLADPTAQVVFVTETGDTRYEAYSVLRPLGSSH